MRLRLAPMLILAALGASSCSTPRDSQPPAAGADSAASMTPVQRGAYLATVAGCHDCHTPGGFYGVPDMSRALSGSELGWKGPWGVSYARNLTPDATGLAAWTDEEILNALQTGVRKDGSPMAPPMPWPDFAHLTRSDALAIVAYLRSLPAVRHEMPARVPPGGQAAGSIIAIPPAPDWDKPRG